MKPPPPYPPHIFSLTHSLMSSDPYESLTLKIKALKEPLSELISNHEELVNQQYNNNNNQMKNPSSNGNNVTITSTIHEVIAWKIDKLNEVLSKDCEQ